MIQKNLFIFNFFLLFFVSFSFGHNPKNFNLYSSLSTSPLFKYSHTSPCLSTSSLTTTSTSFSSLSSLSSPSLHKLLEIRGGDATVDWRKFVAGSVCTTGSHNFPRVVGNFNFSFLFFFFIFLY